MKCYPEVQANQSLWFLYVNDNMFRSAVDSAINAEMQYTEFLERYAIMSSKLRIEEFNRKLNEVMSEIPKQSPN